MNGKNMKMKKAVKISINIVIVMSLLFTVFCPNVFADDVVINIAVIPGVTAPATGATPVTAITETAQYTGTVTWNGDPVTFASATVYTATITLTAKAGFTLTGVAANFFTVAGAAPVTNAANSGVVTAVFPATTAVTTNDATGVEETNATLQGTLTYDGGLSCTVDFQYGLTTGYGSDTSDQSKTTGQSFNINQGSLTQGSLYHYRSRAINTGGTAYGSDKTFLTKPNEPTSLIITNFNTQQNLSWTHGIGYNRSVVKGTIGSYPATPQSGKSIYNGTGNIAINTGLTLGDTWYYRVWEYTIWSGVSKFSDTYAEGVLKITNNVAPTVTITKPDNDTWYNSMTNITGTATDSGGSGINRVNLTIYNTTGHKYWTGTTWQTSTANLTTTGTTSWYKIALLPTWVNGTTYVINATAIDNLGNRGTKHSHTFYYDTYGPVISVISSGTPSTTSATITWTTNENATGNVTYGATTSYGSWSEYSSYVTSHVVPLTGLSPHTTYHYKVISYDRAGNAANSTDHMFTTPSSGGGGNPPSNPTPIAEAAGPYSGYVNVLITFDGSRSTETGGVIVGYRWDWTNDGTYDTGWSTSASTTYAYTNAGSYTVKLQVKDNSDVTATDTATVTITIPPGTKASQDIMDTILTEYGVSLTTPFYANDTNGDGIVDVFTDPNNVLTAVSYVNISGHASFLISTNEDNIPEFFWETTTNTITPVHHSAGSIIDTVDNTDTKTMAVTVSVEKANWTYIEITDLYPDNPDLIVKTADGRIISSEMIWRKDGKIFILDDPVTEYQVIYRYAEGSLFDVTLELTPDSVHVGENISALITLINVGESGLVNGTVNYTLYKGGEIVWSFEENVSVLSQKTYTKTISTDGLSPGSYTYKVTYSYAGGQTASAQGIFTVEAVQQPLWENILLWAVIVIIILIIVIIAILYKLGYLYFDKKEK